MLLLANFPNESEGTDHIHVHLDTVEAANEWLGWARLHYGNAIDAWMVAASECPLCQEEFATLRRRGDF